MVRWAEKRVGKVFSSSKYNNKSNNTNNRVTIDIDREMETDIVDEHDNHHQVDQLNRSTDHSV